MCIRDRDYVGRPEEMDRIKTVEAVYPLTGGITNKMINKYIRQALARVPKMPEWLDEHYRQAEDLPAFNEALAAVHNPQSDADILPSAPARRRRRQNVRIRLRIVYGGQRFVESGQVFGLPVMFVQPFRHFRNPGQRLADIFVYHFVGNAAGQRINGFDGLNPVHLFRTPDIVPVSYTHLTLPTSDLV